MLFIRQTSLKPAGAHNNQQHTRKTAHSQLKEVTGKTHNNPYSMYLSVSQLKPKQASLWHGGEAVHRHL